MFVNKARSCQLHVYQWVPFFYTLLSYCTCLKMPDSKSLLLPRHFNCVADKVCTAVRMTRLLNVAVEGCCHGELDTIYQGIAENERKTRRKVDLLLVCGDFECVRDIVDLECLAVPTKYRKLNSFHQYVTGEKVAPVTTIFVGGNHEASNVLQSLYYGGWVAPKIYFLGFAGVVNFRGLRIAGLSGIFNQKHYRAGTFYMDYSNMFLHLRYSSYFLF